MKTMRSDCSIADLSEAQRFELYDWVKSYGYAKALEMAAKPAAENGFDLRVHRTTLVRFFLKEQKERHRRDLAELAAAAAPDDLPDEANQLVARARANFAHALYELSSEADLPENFDRLAANLHRLDANRLREKEILLQQERIALMRERVTDQRIEFEFNAARALLDHAAECMAVLKDPQTDSEDKIWQVRSIAFGKAAPPMSPQAKRGVKPVSQPAPGANGANDTLSASLALSRSAAAAAPPNTVAGENPSPAPAADANDTLSAASSASTASTSKTVAAEPPSITTPGAGVNDTLSAAPGTSARSQVQANGAGNAAP